MRVCLAQINTTPGDFAGNLDRIEAGIRAAQSGGCDVVVFPELAIPGYLSQDLMYHMQYLQENQRVLADVVRLSAQSAFENLCIVVGYIERNEGPGKPFYNAAAVIQAGRQIFNHRKNLLPFYDVFDEQRYFEAGTALTILPLKGQTVGIAICEDLWNDKGEDGYPSRNNPLAQYRAAGVDVLLSLNSSPFVHDKLAQRHAAIAENLGDMTLVYVNQWGGQDELVFDGQSFVVQGQSILYQSQEVSVDEFAVVDCAPTKPPLALPQSPDKRQTTQVDLYDLLVLSVRDYVQKSGFEQLVLASSGGIDSALVAQIACDAVGPKQVHAIRMPSVWSSSGAGQDAIALHTELGCWDYEVPIAHLELVASLNQQFSIQADPENLVTQVFAADRYSTVADQNIQARLRDLYVMHFSNAFGAMPLSTGNKTESACGYYTHFDMSFSFAPIKDLYKWQVFALATAGGRIPAEIIVKPPSAELAPDQTDEASLLPYAILDPLVQAYIEDYVNEFDAFKAWVEQAAGDGRRVSMDLTRLRDWLKESGSSSRYQSLIKLIAGMEYKRRQTCPGPKVSKVAFGMGRRIPIVKKFN
jgi:NAD+ synthase (glutamine-hydrolysing)